MAHLSMRLRLTGFAWLCVFSLSGWAGSPVWQLSNAAQPFYIAGTIHVMRPGDYPLPAALEQAYQASDVLVLEMDLSDATQEYFRQQIAITGLYPQGQSSRSAFSPEIVESIQAQLAKDQLTFVQVERPWLLALTLMHLELQRHGASPEYGIDSHYYHRAIIDQKTVEALETADAQLNVLAAMGEISADQLLTQFMSDIAQVPTLFGNMTAAWRNGNYQAIDDDLTAELRAEQPAFYQSIMVERNRKWLDKIDALIQSGKPVLVLVGSAHLAGPDSLITMLAERGHAFAQVDEVVHE